MFLIYWVFLFLMRVVNLLVCICIVLMFMFVFLFMVFMMFLYLSKARWRFNAFIFFVCFLIMRFLLFFYMVWYCFYIFIWWWILFVKRCEMLFKEFIVLYMCLFVEILFLKLNVWVIVFDALSSSFMVSKVERFKFEFEVVCCVGIFI